MQTPNIIVILLDNLGYGDAGCYGSTLHRTPNVDRLANEGIRFTDFYSTSGVCTPSRASLLTGCYPRRVNLHSGGSGHAVLMPVDSKGLHPSEQTLADVLKSQGYATTCIGKWHLGDQPPFLPTRHGFDSFFGCPYSEDMVPNDRNPDRPPLPLMRDETVIEAPLDRSTITRRYTEESVRFIRDHHAEPFFLYLPHAMPGSTSRPFASPPFQGVSANGPYGDAVEELDWSVGQILDVLDELDLTEKTLVLWTSDNGAVYRDPPQGSNAPLRGWGYNTSEGAHRMPCIVRWPGHIKPGVVCDTLLSMMDIYPTASALANATLPRDRVVDGQDIAPLLIGDTAFTSRYDEDGFLFYHMQQLQAVRSGPWKLYLPLENKIENLRGALDKGVRTPAALYDVRRDPSETHEVSASHPDVVDRLSALAESARNDLGDWDRQGSGQRPAGTIKNPTPRLLPRNTP